MYDIRRILVALDLHPGGRTLTAGSCSAADQALALARVLAAEVVLFHSSAADEAWDSQQQEYVEVAGESPESRRPAIEEVARRFRAAGVDTRVVTRAETAWLAIVQCVLRERIDLVVAGKRSQRVRDGRRLGSVSSKLLRKCPCAVWVAKPESAAAPRRVLAASDLSRVGERVIDYAGFVAAHFGAALHVVHAYQLPLEKQLEGAEQVADFDRREREQRTRRLEAEVARTKGAPVVSYHVGRTSPSQAILACVARLDPDLVVMGTVSRGGVPGLLVGNTAERLLGRLDCSLLCVKPDDFVCPVSATT